MTRTLAGRHLTVFWALFGLLTPSFAARADETAELIARLREAAKKQPSTRGDSYDLGRFGYVELGGVMEEIGVAQLGLGDLEGALDTSASVPVDNNCRDCGDSYRIFLHDLSVALTEARRYDAAFEMLKRHHENHNISAGERLPIARAQAKVGDFNAARRTCQAAIQVIEADPYICCGSKDEFGAVRDLTSVAFAQVSNADPSAARTTRERIAVLLRKLPAKGHERAGLNARLAVLDAKIGDRAAAQRDLLDGAQALVQDAPTEKDRLNYSWCWRCFAEASCRLGDVTGARRELFRIDDSSGGEAYASVALYELSQRHFNEAKTTILAGPVSEKRDLVLVEIARAQAQIDRNYKEALVSVGQIKNDTIRARATLEVAAVMAQRGLREEARTLAGRLDSPRLEKFGKRTEEQFKFDDLKTWSAAYEASKGFSVTSRSAGEELDGELLAAAVRCRVALQGRGAIPFLNEMNKSWDIQKAAEAQASEDDAAGALAWADKLATPERRLVALIATAEGHAAYLGRSHRKQAADRRLGRWSSLNRYGVGLGHLFGDD
jgi:hypothetical protein